MKNCKALISLLLLLGCLITVFPITVYGSENISGEIQVFSNVAETEMQKYLEAFSKKYPDITVNYHCLTDYESEMKTLLKNGTYGDVLFIPGFIQESQYSTYFSVLGQYTVLSQKYNYLDISARSGDNIYGIPSYAYTTGILYNKDVFYYAGISDGICSYMKKTLIRKALPTIRYMNCFTKSWNVVYAKIIRWPPTGKNPNPC